MILMSKIPFIKHQGPVMSVLREFRRDFWVVGLFSFVSNLLMLTPTLYMLQVYDRVLLSRSELTLMALTLFCLFFFAVMAFSEWFRSRMIVRISVKLDEILGDQVFKAAFEDQLRYSGRNPLQAFADLTTLRQWLTGAGVFAFFDAPWTPVYVGVMFMLHPFLGFLSIVFLANLTFLAWLTHRLTTQANEDHQEEEKELNTFLFSKLRNAEVIEAHGMLPNLRARWLKRQHQTQLVHDHALRMEQRMHSLTKFFRYLQQSLALGAGALVVIHGHLSAGAMIAATVLMARASQPLDMIVSGWRGYIAARTAFTRLETLLSAHPQRQPYATPSRIRGLITLDRLVATAPQRQAPILKELTASFEPSQAIVVLGPSGSGKSTLSKTLLGIWLDITGDVLIDGVSVQKWDREQLGTQIGYLPQDVELFQGTVAENIARFGDIDSEQVIAAAERTGIHQMILRLPHAYDTRIGPGGRALSGGQRQRIGLARAIYGNPRLVVLDEPNANLDDLGEAALKQTVCEMRDTGTTVFLVTHRPSILEVADTVVLMRDGHIEDMGPRDEVMARRNAPAVPANVPASPQAAAVPA